MALNPTGQISIGGPVTGQSVNLELTLSATANSNMNQANFRALAGIPSGIIALSNFWGKTYSTATQRAIFLWGNAPNAPSSGTSAKNTVNLISSTGVVAANVSSIATIRQLSSGATYGGDKGIAGFGSSPPVAPAVNNITNLISNTGVVASDVSGIGTAAFQRACAAYGTDKAIFAYGTAPPASVTWVNLVSNTGVLAANTPTANVAGGLSGAKYGTDTAIMGLGASLPSTLGRSNLVSNTGVMAAIISNAGTTARSTVGAANYGGDKAIFAYGSIPPTTTASSISNLVSNTGVVAANTPGVGTARIQPAGSNYGLDKAIFGLGRAGPSGAFITAFNLVSNTGVIAADTPSVAQGRSGPAACGFSYTA